MITLQLLDSYRKIQGDIFKAIADELNQKLEKGKSTIENKIKNFVSTQINNSYEMIELRGGYLQGALGVTYPQTAVEAIVNSVASSVRVSMVKFNHKLTGGLWIYIQPSTFANLLTLPAGHTVYSGGDLHWLQWLLTLGDKFIVVGYDYSPESGLGRTGLGTMELGGSFRVPPEFSGTLDDNFITRSILTYETDKFLTKTLEDTLK
tara:strand:+ start:1607 stop:2224 length:618 start_codon:yes stop_codon:yes gene_type:complete